MMDLHDAAVVVRSNPTGMTGPDRAGPMTPARCPPSRIDDHHRKPTSRGIAS
jgi:hypothetical protein